MGTQRQVAIKARAALAVSCCLAIAPSAFAERTFAHTGEVVIMHTGQPIGDVEIAAWPELGQSGLLGGRCPEYGKTPLAAAHSNSSSGKFTLNVGSSSGTYTITYCAGDEFFPRVDTRLSNDRNGSPIVPTPVGLLPKDIAPEDYESLVKHDVTLTLNLLHYLWSADPEKFNAAVNQLTSETGEANERQRIALKQVTEIVRNWGR
jgi:hypothetical protein